MVLTFIEKPVDTVDLDAKTLGFLQRNNLVGIDQGDDSAAILVLREDNTFAEIAGAACPNALRRKFPTLLREAGVTTLRLKGVNVFPLIQNVSKIDIGDQYLLLTFDRRKEWICSPAQGGVAGGETFEQGGYAELSDEFFAVGVLDGLITRVVPNGMPATLDENFLNDDNPFRVQIEQVVRSGDLYLAGYHDNEEESYITAFYHWRIGDVPGILPLLLGAQGNICFGWQDARIPVNGSITGAKVRVQGVVQAHDFWVMRSSGQMRSPLPLRGIFQGTQGFMPLRTGEESMLPLHPTLEAYLQMISVHALD